MHTNRAKRFSFDIPGFSDAGFAASARFRRRSVILNVRKKKTMRVLPVLFLCVFAFSACSRTRLYTESDVSAFVKDGMSVQSVIERFGPPTSDMPAIVRDESGKVAFDQVVYFDLPGDAVSGDYVFSGFQVRALEGKVVSWSSTHRSTR